MGRWPRDLSPRCWSVNCRVRRCWDKSCRRPGRYPWDSSTTVQSRLHCLPDMLNQDAPVYCPGAVNYETDRQPCIAAHPMDFFWKAWGRRISLLVWCQGQTQDTAQPEINHDPAPTSTPTNRPLPRDSVCLVLSSTIPSFQSVPLGFSSGCNQVSHQP